MPSNDWLRRGPELDELVASVSVIKTQPGKRCALIMPVHNELGYLKSHLDALKKQTTSDFDVIVVHSPGLDVSWLKKTPYGMIILSLKEPLGAGAFYAGEKYAFEQGYTAIILADVDALPISPGIVQRLAGLASADKGAVFIPSRKSLPGTSEGAPIHWYGAMNRSVLEQSGLSYLPLFFGGEDTELMQRMRGSGIRFVRVEDVFMDHPRAKHIRLEQGVARTKYYIRNHGLMMYRHNGWSLTALALAFCSACFFDRLDRFSLRLKWALEAMRDLARLDLSARYVAGEFKLPPYEEVPLDEALSSGKRVRALIAKSNTSKDAAETIAMRCSGLGISAEEPLRKSLSVVAYLSRLFRLALQNDTLVMCVGWEWNFSPPLLLVPNLYVSDGERLFAIQRDPNALSRVFRFMVSMSALTVLTLIYLPISFISWLRLRGAFRGYGLSGKK
jgi:GT2 family glycosyltransferase